MSDSLLSKIARLTARHYMELQALILENDHSAGMRSVAAPVAVPAASDDEPEPSVQAPPVAKQALAQAQETTPAPALASMDFSLDDDEPVAAPAPTPAPTATPKRGRRSKAEPAPSPAPVQTALPTAPASVDGDDDGVLASFGAVAADDELFPSF